MSTRRRCGRGPIGSPAVARSQARAWVLALAALAYLAEGSARAQSNSGAAAADSDSAAGLPDLRPGLVPRTLPPSTQLPQPHQPPSPSPAPPQAPLGRLEQESVDESLAALGLARDLFPEGKMIGALHIVNQEVFSRRDWWFQFFNLFHRTTRTASLRRELLMKPGDLYDASLVEETIRNLQSPPKLSFAGSVTFAPPELSSASVPFVPPELSSVVVILPVTSPEPGKVDLLVVTRDVWSLRFNTDFEFQQNTLSLLLTSLSENNLFGWRKYLSVGFELDQGRWGAGPTYFDPNIHGTHLTFYAAAMAWYARDTQLREGDDETVSLRYPLFSLASRWGAGIDLGHQNIVARSFLGTELRPQNVLLPSGATEQVPAIYRRRVLTVDGNVIRAFGSTVIQRLTLGHLFDSRRSEVLPGFSDPAAAQPFLDQYAPASEQRSEPYVRYELFLARYGVFRDLDTFDLRENRNLGPHVTLRVAYGLPALGADFRALAVNAATTWSVEMVGAYAQVSLLASARFREGGEVIDQARGASIYAASPSVWQAFRLVLSAAANTRRADTTRAYYLLGGSTGLRGYAINQFQGTTDAIAHAELRFTPAAVFSQRFGALLFYDVGDAAPSFSTLLAYHDLGVGLRWLIPQLNTSVLRFDWAFATQDAGSVAGSMTRAGWPGRLTAGFQQIF